MLIFWLAIAVLLLAVSGFYSGAEMGFYCVNRLRVRLQAEQTGQSWARSLLYLAQHPQETVLTTQLGTNLANYLLAVVAAKILTKGLGISSHSLDLYIAAILTPLVFVFGDVVPKNWFQIEADRLMAWCAGWLRTSEFIFRFTGLPFMIRQVTRLIVRLSGHEGSVDWHTSRVEVVGLLREGGAEGTITEEQTRIIERVMDLSSTRVGAIMVPWQRVITVPDNADRALFENIVAAHPYSRLPVMDSKGKTVVGIVTVYNVLAEPIDNAIRRWMAPPLMISASETVTHALVRLQKSKQTMAIVSDPRRGFVGIVTLKDIIEEIVGELAEW